MANDDIILKLIHVEWRRNEDVSSECRNLIQAYFTQIGPIVADIGERTHVTPAVAHGVALTAGRDSVEYSEALDRLFADVPFTGAGAREPIIALFAGAIGWNHDEEFRRVRNPWLPLVAVCLSGYPVSFDDSLDESRTDLLVGCANKIERFTPESCERNTPDQTI